MEYKLIAAGGTFDHLHDGHKTFLLWLFTKAEHVLLGLTSDEFASNTKQTSIESFDVRKKHIENFLREENVLNRLIVVAIDDVYGPLLTQKFAVDAMGVTEDTYEGAEKINVKREELELGSLPILTLKLHMGNNSQPISSTAIRQGNINAKGEIWIKEDWTKHMYVLPQNMRNKLHQPFGLILSSIPQNIDSHKTITVGDVTTKLFNMHKIGQKLSIIDFIVERTQLFHSLDELEFVGEYKQVILKNPAGHIAAESWSCIEHAIKNDSPTVIRVEGEEDLLVLVCILVAPLGYHIFYGQPHVGLVQVEVTLEVKQRAFELMDEFVRVEL